MENEPKGRAIIRNWNKGNPMWYLAGAIAAAAIVIVLYFSVESVPTNVSPDLPASVADK